MKFVTSAHVLLVVAANFFYPIKAMPQTPAAQVLSAKDEAIPTLRDAAVIVLSHVRVIDGTGTPVKENQTLIVQGGRILALGSAGEVKIPEGARTLDLAGRSVLPGLVMLHEHLNYDAAHQDGGHPQHFTFPRLHLAYGVTTIRTAGSSMPYMDLNLKRRIDTGKTPGPEIHLTSPFLSGEGDPFLDAIILRNAQETRRDVRYWAAEGFTSFKAYQWIPKDELAALIDESHLLKLPVTAHLGHSVSCREAAEMGIDNLEHGFGPCILADSLEANLNGPRTEALLRALLDRHVVLTETPNRRWQLSDFELQLLDSSARERYLAALAAHGPVRPPFDGLEPRESPYAKLLRAFVQRGGRIVLGTDAACCHGSVDLPGIANHIAIEMLVSMGFAPLDAIRIATLEGARFLGIQERTGSIQAGKEADLFIVRGNPAERIEDIENVEMVFANGVPYDPKTLLEKVKGQVGWQ